jgi:hypothetical protein
LPREEEEHKIGYLSYAGATKGIGGAGNFHYTPNVRIL